MVTACEGRIKVSRALEPESGAAIMRGGTVQRGGARNVIRRADVKALSAIWALNESLIAPAGRSAYIKAWSGLQAWLSATTNNRGD